MSSKVDIFQIILEHYKTLKDDESEKISFLDLLVFLGIPLVIVLINIVFCLTVSQELRSALINFGAIFSALLISVLVLVYDQRSKIYDRREKLSPEQLPNFDALFTTLKELYHNICYGILISLLLVVFSLLQIVTVDLELVKLNLYVINPLVVFAICSTILTTLMIVKRLHKLLINFDRFTKDNDSKQDEEDNSES
ncbi:hypothetical protein CWB76_13280 [Pseudoalteromonas sp. S1609]|uniref:hypothetical protein n=1 Tax=Pseudoalteromonas sp. S1609 TaxID=579505 RepID=UPI00110B626B|nr:hypothetical protein [Pseudoalteromonas sp. S1609]TMP69245.1 hypothetical protein CWB76_13280 [Pseudoalteromonas sp. S1609]